MSETRSVALYIDPPSHHFLQDRLFALSEGRFYSSLAKSCVYVRDRLAAKGVPVHTADYIPPQPGDTRIVYVSLGGLKDYRRLSERPDVRVSAFFAMECPVIVPDVFRELGKAQHYFKRVYSPMDATALERFVGGPLRSLPCGWPLTFDRVDQAIWSQTDRQFLVMINMNKLTRYKWEELYSERMRAVEFFSRFGEIDLYGVGWDVPSFVVGTTWMPGTVQRIQRMAIASWQRVRPEPLLMAARRVWRGQAESKHEVMGRYKFALCFENMILKGWATEKIFDCFFAGTIPIYWGAPDIEAQVPPECFIDMRRFSGYPDLRAFLKSLSAEDIQGYRESARSFVESPQFYRFTKEAFADLFLEMIQTDSGIRIE